VPARNGPILIAGFGSIGRRHFRNLRALGCEDFVFLRSRRGTVEDDEIRDFRWTADLDEALSFNPCIAIIANPSALHLPVALRAAEANCDLYIEKPLSHSMQGADRLAEVVRERGLVAMIGCQFRFHPLLNELKQQIAAGRLGQIAGADARWGEYLPGWHPWEDHRQSYSSRAELGGGVILTLIHPFDYLHWLFGPANRVQSSTAAVPSLETAAGEDWADVLLEYENRVIAHVHVDYLQRPAIHDLTVCGSQGRAVCDFQAGSLTYTAVDGTTEHHRVPDNFERNSMFVDCMRHFLQCTMERLPTLVPLQDGIDVLRTAIDAQRLAARESHV
jgi:predicted dehydrogenase